jgi:prepilin signal peptidase PulO-like enzyme (type II secretory pathway)
LQRVLIASMALASLWLINAAYVMMFKRDAFGFGDVKWTGLAAFGLGLKTVFWAWCIGAWLGIFWLIGRKIVDTIHPRYQSGEHIHFTPFLLLGLIAALLLDSSYGEPARNWFISRF